MEGKEKALFRSDKLTPREIDKTVSRIKEEYDHGIVHLALPLSRKRAFEERFLLALRNRTDMTLFLGVEVRVVKELLVEAEKLFHNPPAPPQPVAKKKHKSYADRVLEKLQAKIKGYPGIDLGNHDQKSLDVEKLYGILHWFSQNIWKDLYAVLIKKNPQPLLFRLDDDLVWLTAPQGKIPKALESYTNYLSNPEVPLSLLAKAQNQGILDGAHFVHRMRDLVGEVLILAEEKAWSRENPTPSEIHLIKKTAQLMDRVLADFRLKDLKPPR